MDLLLWRHAEAEDTGLDGSDLSRALTPKGRRQAAAIADWLTKHGPQEPRILVSPALRTQQTAQALGREFETCHDLAPDASASQLIKACGWPKGHLPREAIILVGHQPTLGQLAARLLGGREANWSVKKGAVWWLQHRSSGGTEETVLKLVLPPEFA
jgi:phosphohistidine phosphatase